eukprot:SAG25_NODE_1711_length_2496_cov_1.630371_1_plen_301_part_00
MQRLRRVRAHLRRGCGAQPQEPQPQQAAGVAAAAAPIVGESIEFEVTLRTTGADDGAPVDGRLLLLISHEPEPMSRVGFMDALQGCMMVGVDVDGLRLGQAARIGGATTAFPLDTLGAMPEGRYWVQVVLNRYETFHLQTGHTVKLPPGDGGDGQSWQKAPGNLFSVPQQLQLTAGAKLSISLDQVMPDIEPPADTRYIKHVRIRSERLSNFWGREMMLGAHVLLPEGFEDHPEARYPLALFHGHFPADFEGFRPEPPDVDLEPDYAARFKLAGYNKITQQEHHTFYKRWTQEEGFPRFL